MEDLSYYSSFILTTLLCCFAMFVYRNKVKSGAISENKAKNIYSLFAVVLGICGGTLIFHGLIWLFGLFGIKTAFGHGEILISVIFFNFILGMVLFVIGRVIIGWKSFQRL